MGKYTLNKEKSLKCALSFIDWMFPGSQSPNSAYSYIVDC